jgi:PAS domain S-box-containing protein
MQLVPGWGRPSGYARCDGYCRMLGSISTQTADRRTADRGDGRRSWAASIGIAAAVGIAYLLAARLGQSFLTLPNGIAVFWPAAGIAAGAAIALGATAWLPVAAGVVAGAILANPGGEWSLSVAIAVATFHTGQALLIAWLIERYCGPTFSLNTLPRVLFFFLATGVSVATMGAVGAAGCGLFQNLAPALSIWLRCLSASALGIIVVAPLAIGIAQAFRDPPKVAEVLEGACILAVLVFVAMLGFGQSTQHWFTTLPFALLLPLLIWPAARCPPVFSAAAVLVVALVIAASLTFGVGRLGDGSVPLSTGLLAAQTASVPVAICTLVVAALFAERRSREAMLTGSNRRLRSQEEAFRRLLGALPAAIYTTDKAGCITYCNNAAVALWGRHPEVGKDNWADLWRLHYPDGRSVPPEQRPTRIVLNEGRAVRGREALLERPDGTLVPIMPCPAPLIDERGRVVGVVNMQLDLTEQKRAEVALAERDTLLTLASKAARVGSYTLDCTTGIVRLTPGCAALYGFPEGTTELSVAKCRACVHPEDSAGVDAQFAQAFKEQQREHVAQFRIVRPSDGETRWIESRTLVSYNAGLPSRIVGIDIDVTERKRAEAEIKESESRLADALTAGQVIAFEWDATTRRTRRSANAALILGYEKDDGVHSSPSDDFTGRIHPDDRESFRAHISGLRADKPSYALSFRFRSPDGRQLWLEETAKGEFDAAGRLLRIKGLTRNITDRKEAERALADRNMQLSLAGKASRVGSFSLDLGTEEIQASEGYAAIHGLPDGTSHTTRAKWKAGVHPDDFARIEELRKQAVRERRREHGVEYRIVHANGEIRWIEARCLITYRSDGRPERIVGVHIDVTARKRAEEHQCMLIAELDHRVKNVLATVSAVASRTQEAGVPPSEFVATLAGRIQSMAATHELLSGHRWEGIALRELVRRELAPYMTGINTELNGPDLTLRPEAAQAVSMVLHELTTNAAKHGALSTDSGRVSVRWLLTARGHAHDQLRIEWQETGGPPVRAPERSGYGTDAIRDLIPYELDGTVDLEFAPQGARCVLNIPVGALKGINRPGIDFNGLGRRNEPLTVSAERLSARHGLDEPRTSGTSG